MANVSIKIRRENTDFKDWKLTEFTLYRNPFRDHFIENFLNINMVIMVESLKIDNVRIGKDVLLTAVSSSWEAKCSQLSNMPDPTIRNLSQFIVEAPQLAPWTNKNLKASVQFKHLFKYLSTLLVKKPRSLVVNYIKPPRPN